MKTPISWLSGVLIPGIVLIAGCVWDNAEELHYGAGFCDTASVSFTMDIVPILSNNCYSCHSNLNAPSFGDGLSFEDYRDVAGNAERIIGAINHKEGFQPMPRDANKLDPCSINLIETWARSGAPDN